MIEKRWFDPHPPDEREHTPHPRGTPAPLATGRWRLGK